MNLTQHFTLEELTHSEMAIRRGIANVPPSDVLPRLVNLAQHLELIRALLGSPLIVTSGYRSPEVNRAVGGSSVSAHCKGDAADFICPGFGPAMEVAKRIVLSPIVFDQVIYEGTWVHISFDRRMRRNALTAHFSGGPASYTEGIA